MIGQKQGHGLSQYSRHRSTTCVMSVGLVVLIIVALPVGKSFGRPLIQATRFWASSLTSQAGAGPKSFRIVAQKSFLEYISATQNPLKPTLLLGNKGERT